MRIIVVKKLKHNRDLFDQAAAVLAFLRLIFLELIKLLRLRLVCSDGEPFLSGKGRHINTEEDKRDILEGKCLSCLRGFLAPLLDASNRLLIVHRLRECERVFGSFESFLKSSVSL